MSKFYNMLVMESVTCEDIIIESVKIDAILEYVTEYESVTEGFFESVKKTFSEIWEYIVKFFRMCKNFCMRVFNFIKGLFVKNKELKKETKEDSKKEDNDKFTIKNTFSMNFIATNTSKLLGGIVFRSLSIPGVNDTYDDAIDSIKKQMAELSFDKIIEEIHKSRTDVTIKYEDAPSDIGNMAKTIENFEKHCTSNLKRSSEGYLKTVSDIKDAKLRKEAIALVNKWTKVHIDVCVTFSKMLISEVNRYARAMASAIKDDNGLRNMREERDAHMTNIEKRHHAMRKTIAKTINDNRDEINKEFKDIFDGSNNNSNDELDNIDEIAAKMNEDIDVDDPDFKEFSKKFRNNENLI